MQVFGFFIPKEGGESLFQQADTLLAYIQSHENGDQPQRIATHAVEPGSFGLPVPKAGTGVARKGGAGGEPAKQSGKEESPCLG